MAKNILKSDKLSKSHSTYIGLTELVIKELNKYPEISKIALGPIKQGHARERRVKVSDDKRSVRVACRDIEAIQYIWVFGCSKSFVEEKLSGILS